MIAHCVNRPTARVSQRNRGVTLVELLTVMVVVAILASIAIPSYRNYLLRAQRSDATRTLLHIQSAQEKFYLQNKRYADQAELEPASPVGLGIPAVSENGFYDISLASPDGTNYTATAVPRPGAGQTDDTPCQTFRVDQSLNKFAGDGSNRDTRRECWR